MARKQRLPIGTVRAFAAGVDLFRQKKTPRQKRRIVKKAMRNTRIIPPESLDPLQKRIYNDSYAQVSPVPFFYRIEATPAALRNKATMLHELAHFFRVGKNHFLTASSVSGYILAANGEFKPRTQDRHYPDTVRMVEAIANGKLKAVGRFGNPEKIGHGLYSIRWNGEIAGIDSTALAYNFGAFALAKELEWKKPASGLFLVREICKGTPAEAAIKKIESGALDAEIRTFAKKHLANLLSRPKNSPRGQAF